MNLKYLQNDEGILHAEVIRGQSLTLPNQLLALSAEESTEVKGLDPK